MLVAEKAEPQAPPEQSEVSIPSNVPKDFQDLLKEMIRAFYDKKFDLADLKLKEINSQDAPIPRNWKRKFYFTIFVTNALATHPP